jgi:hypothetical protein
MFWLSHIRDGHGKVITASGVAARDRPHCPPRPVWRQGTQSASPTVPYYFKTPSSPATFPTTFSFLFPLPFPPSPFLHGPVVPVVSTSSTSPAARVAAERYDEASKTNASSQSPALTRSTPRPSLSIPGGWSASTPCDIRIGSPTMTSPGLEEKDFE